MDGETVARTARERGEHEREKTGFATPAAAFPLRFCPPPVLVTGAGYAPAP